MAASPHRSSVPTAVWIGLFAFLVCPVLFSQEAATPAETAPAASADAAASSATAEEAAAPTELPATVVQSTQPAPAPAPAPEPAPVPVAPSAPVVKAPAPVILNDAAPYVADVPVSAGRNDIPQMEN
ncbi:MAG: hypothetical protein GXX91_15630, partial [Verrucomicrobiaceae bacterium]|nr:hypothetical protein [Verrucomicrobiaceae bacterium]